MVILCALCDREVERPQDAYRKVSGYVRKRGGGGANAIRLREVSDTYAHTVCVDMRASGLSGQGGLFDA